MRYIIDFVDGASSEGIDAYLTKNSCEVVSHLHLLGKTYVVDASAEPSTDALVQHMSLDDEHGVSLLSDATSKSFTITDDDNWWKVAVLSQIDLNQTTSKIARTGQNVRVYILDSGIDEKHEDFVGKKITLLHSLTGEFSDTKGHGTALASIIVGETCGITEADLKVVKISHAGRPTLVSDILTAFQKVAEDYMADSSRPAVLNLSWAIKKDTVIESKILALVSMGVIASVAAGNSGTPVPDVTPASMKEVITVGSFGPDLHPSSFTDYTAATDTSLTKGDTNFGPGLDMFAPGEQIKMAKVGGGFGYTAGTSAAAAVASACFVIFLARMNNTFEQHSYGATMTSLTTDWVTRDLLTLEGQYADSPNVVPRAYAVAYEHGQNPPVRTTGDIVPSGKPFHVWVFNPDVYTSAEILTDGTTLPCTVAGNWITGTAPNVDSYEFFTVNMKVTTAAKTSDTFQVQIAVFNDQNYSTAADAAKDAGLILLGNCPGGCPPATLWCCGACTKTTCGTGPTGAGCVASSGSC